MGYCFILGMIVGAALASAWWSAIKWGKKIWWLWMVAGFLSLILVFIFLGILLTGVFS